MKLQEPTVGPIVGFTTATETRLWLRAQFEAQGSSYRRCFGAVRVRRSGAKDWGDPRKDKLSANFDMTGVFPITGLTADTEYEYQAGWFFADAELEEVQAIGALDWSAVKICRFRTGTASLTDKRSYVVGSCRYLLRLFGGTIFDDRGDKIFRSVLEQIEKNKRVDALLMIGDQIYADDLNFVAPDTRLDQFFERYRTAFSQEFLRKLMSSVPTYMILDDHEIEDNWPSKATDKDRITLYPHAIHAYQAYQCSHSPLFPLDEQGRITGTLSHLWYTFKDGCSDWFVMDVRTERIVGEEPIKRRMIKAEQLDALLSWLSDGSGLVKMVVTSVPFFPDASEENEDKWGGFKRDRSIILNHILKEKVRKVAFVSGDIHCSFTARLTSPDDPEFSVFSIVSSSFFWPYPHMSESDFAFSAKLATDGEHQYVVGKPSPVHSTDNFARLDIDPTGISVSFFERKGAPLGKPVKLKF